MNYIAHTGCQYTTKLTLLLILLLVINVPFFGQNKKPVFRSLQQGLSHQQVKCILKDSKGFMWFGTKDGLNKFDGTNFIVYENRSGDTTSISHNAINAVIEDEKKNIWVGTSDGLNLYNRDKDNFTRIKVPGVEYLYVNAICADNHGNIFIGTIGVGVIIYDFENSRFEICAHRDNDSRTVSSNFVISVVADKENNIWIGTRNGLNLYDKNNRTFRYFIHSPNNPEELSNNFVSTLFADDENNLWIGTLGGGVNKLTRRNGEFIFSHYQHSDKAGSLSTNSILSLCSDDKDNLWIGTENGGLNYLDIRTGNIRVYQAEEGNPYSLTSNSIWSLYKDDMGILWIGTYNRGLNVFDKKYVKFELYQRKDNAINTLTNNDVTGFMEDAFGNLWIATDGGGLSCFNTHSRQFTKTITKTGAKNSLSHNSIESIILDSRKNFWLGTWTGGIDHLNEHGIKIKNYKVESQDGNNAGDNNIMSLYEDKHHNIWAGTAGSGLFWYDTAQDKFIKVIDVQGHVPMLSNSFVTSILEDSANTLWIGTLWGLMHMTQNNGQFVFSSYFNNNRKSISSNRITVVFEDSKKRLWLGTEDKGLNLFNRKDNTFINYQKQDGLPNNSIKGILEDKKGNLWISTNKGISKFNPLTGSFTNYTKEDGLNSDAFYNNSCFTSKSGEFFFGGNNGFNAFYPDSIKENTSIPPIYLTEFSIYNNPVAIGDNSPLKKHISQTTEITLSYKQNSFTIDFVALNYTRSSQNQYAYKLEGFDNDWNNVRYKRSATYTKVDPGTYTFKVIGSNNDGIWNKTPATLKITILPPFWKTMWAFILYILFFSSLLFVLIRLMIIRAKQTQLLELDKMKLHFFTNISHELRTPLTLILSPLENLVSRKDINSELQSQLSMIYRNADRLFRLVNELMDFTKTEESELSLAVQPGDIVKFTEEIFEFYTDEAKRRQIDYQFSGAEKIEAWFDRDKIEKVILNLLSNAFKFTPDQGRIAVKVEKSTAVEGKTTKEYVKLMVIDNGIGISQKYIDKIFDRFFQSPEELSLSQSGTGVGLSLSKNLVELHHGKITLTSEKFKETCFSVFLPLGHSHFDQKEKFSTPTDVRTVVTQVQETNNIASPPKNAPVVLIVEDNFELRQYIVAHLSRNYKILEADNGEDGYKIAIKEIPDLIVSDIIMPKMSGTELCKKIKEELAVSHIPFILLTAKITLEERIEGIQTGADIYITKPFNIRFLETTIKNLIDTRHKLFQRFSQEVFIMPKEISSNPPDQTFLKQAIEYIEKNILNEELTVEDLASHLLLSHSQTYRKIKALTGQSVTEFIRTIRLKMAIKLMDKGTHNISEIAFKVGFASPAYFTKCFRQQFGKPPSEYFNNKVTGDE